LTTTGVTLPLKKLLILGSANSWHSRELTRAAVGRCETELYSFSELQSAVGIETDLTSGPIDSLHDPVIVRAMPPGSLEQIIFRMDALAVWQDRGTKIVNPPKALEFAVDKYLSIARLSEAGLPVPPTIACQTFEHAMNGFEALNRDVVVKPLFGSEGKSLMRITEIDLAERAFRWVQQTNSVVYLQQYVTNPGSDIRLLMIGNEVFAIKRCNEHDWRTNVARGATAEIHEPTNEQTELAKTAMAVSGCLIGGVDLIVGTDGQNYLLEINAVPGWKAVQKCHEVDIAKKVLDLVLET